jgi:hypothetical protein
VPLPDGQWLTAEERASAEEFTNDEYPISVGAWRHVSNQLDERDPRVSWLWFQTLDNRVVLANILELEVVALISETAEEMPRYEHEELYRALRDPAMVSLLRGETESATLDSEDAPFSRKIFDACQRYIERIGDLEEALDRQEDISIETVRGDRDSLYLDEDEIAKNEIHILTLAIDDPGAFCADREPMSEWMLNLNSEGYERATCYRLGALRLIQTSRLAFDASVERSFSAAPETSARPQPAGEAADNPA